MTKPRRAVIFLAVMCDERQPKAAAVDANVFQEVRDAAIGMEETRSSTGNKYRNQ